MELLHQPNEWVLGLYFLEDDEKLPDGVDENKVLRYNAIKSIYTGGIIHNDSPSNYMYDPLRITIWYTNTKKIRFTKIG